MASLTGTKIKDTYDALLKVSDNGALDGTLQTITDGLGNNSSLSLSTAGASVTGTLSVSGGITGTLSTAAQTNITSVGTLSSLAVSGNLTVDTNTLYVDAANNRVGIGITPTETLDVAGAIRSRVPNTDTAKLYLNNTDTQLSIENSSANMIFTTAGGAEQMRISSSGFVGIGTDNPDQKLNIDGNDANEVSLKIKNNNVSSGNKFLKLFVGGTTGFGQSSWVNSGVIESAAGTGSNFVLSNYEAGPIIFQTNNRNEKMRIDASGNVGIGVTPASWRSTQKAIQLNSTGSIYSEAGNTHFSDNIYVNSSDQNVYITTNEATVYRQVDGQHIWYNAPSGTAGTAATITQRMRINSSGLVDIGSINSSLAQLNIGRLSAGSTQRALALYNNPSNTADTGVSIEFYPNTGNDDRCARISSVNTSTVNKSDLRFFTSNDAAPVERMRILSSGGLTFNGDTSTSNALDDYEEGTWTPAIKFGGLDTGITYNARLGNYTKVGRKVSVTCYAAISNKGTATGAATIDGLPFTISTGDANYSPIGIWYNNVSFANQFVGYGAPSNTYVNLQEITEGGSVSSLTDANFANNSEFMISLTYFV